MVKNGNEPSIGNVTEEKESELEEFIYYAKLLTATLGHKVFVPITPPVKIIDSPANPEEKEEPILHLAPSKSNKYSATGQRTSDGFIVFANSTISMQPSKSCSSYIKKLRLEHASKIKDNLLTEDILFNSPSGAASFVTYRSTSGLTQWKTEEGLTLKEYEAKNNQ